MDARVALRQLMNRVEEGAGRANTKGGPKQPQLLPTIASAIVPETKEAVFRNDTRVVVDL